MRSSIFMCAATGLIVLHATSTSAQEKPRLEIAAVSIAKAKPEAQFGEGLSRFRSPGIEVDIFVALPGETILAISGKDSKVSLTSDDGGELPLEDRFNGPFNLNLDEEKASGVIQLKSETLPGKKAGRLSIKGEFVVTVGRDSKTDDVDLKVEKGSKLKLGPINGEVGEIGEGFGDEFKQSIEISSKQSFDAVAKVEFLDAKGKAIRSEEAGGSSFGFNEEMTYSRSWQLASDAKLLKVRITYFQKTESIKLPANLDFGIGL